MSGELYIRRFRKSRWEVTTKRFSLLFIQRFYDNDSAIKSDARLSLVIKRTLYDKEELRVNFHCEYLLGIAKCAKKYFHSQIVTWEAFVLDFATITTLYYYIISNQLMYNDTFNSPSRPNRIVKELPETSGRNKSICVISITGPGS